MKLAKALSLAVFLSLLSGVAEASQTTASFQVRLTIQAQCTIVSASTLDFGTNGVINASIDQANTLNVQCTNTTPYNIGLDAGANGGTVATRLMKGGPSNETIGYSLYTTSARNVVWGDTIGTNTIAGTGNGTSQPYSIYGRVGAQTTPAPGNYTDTVTVTVTY